MVPQGGVGVDEVDRKATERYRRVEEVEVEM